MKFGETVTLDHHILCCGDTSKSLSSFVKDKKVDLILSDPPYGVNRMRGRTTTNATHGIIKRSLLDHMREDYAHEPNRYPEFKGDKVDFDPSPMINLNKPTILFGGNYYHNNLPNGKKWYVWLKRPNLDQKSKGSWSDCELIWTNMDGYQCELIHYKWWGMVREGERRLELYTRNHPTQKPVGLLVKFIEKYTEPGDTVLDPYAGGGSTLIACAETGRRCLLMECMPEYCDRIIERYNNYKSETPDTLDKYIAS